MYYFVPERRNFSAVADNWGVATSSEGSAFEAAYESSMALARAGRFGEALAAVQAAAPAAPADWRAHAQAGALLVALHRPEEALVHLRHALELEPERVEVLNNLGAALRAMGRSAEAQEYFERAFALNPGYRDALRNVLAGAMAAGGHDAALERLRRAVGEGVASAAVCDELGTAYWQSGRPEEGVPWLERAVDLEPKGADARARLGNALVEIGRLGEAREQFLQAIACAPHRADFYRFLAETDPMALDGGHERTLETLLQSDLPAEVRADAHFALGKTLAARNLPASAFEHLLAANASVRARAEYDETQTLCGLEEIAAIFSRGMLAERAGIGHPSRTPVFIFGMPRSGTSLVEQIVASHPLVHGAGELEAFADLADAVLAPGRRISAADMLRADGRMLRELGYRYVEAVRGLAPVSAVRITDKMPANFQYAGLIHLALPKAALVHVRRDPLDTCLSCFSHTFAGSSLGWSYDLAELGRYYRAYAQLMEHWRAVLPPGAMLEVRYEDVVADLETQARRILAHCGLPWDDRCLQFHQTKRAVKTASAAQVRKPIYRSSVGKAREYRELLAPLLEALGVTI